MHPETPFDLTDFLPYLLNQAAEHSSLGFQRIYKGRYGMLRSEWRVLFHLGRYGAMTAKEIGALSLTHKTKISRAVRALEEKRFLVRAEVPNDRRQEQLSLTPAGQSAYTYLLEKANGYHSQMAEQFTDDEMKVLERCLKKLGPPTA